MTETKKKPAEHVHLVPARHSPVDRRQHIWCDRCDERHPMEGTIEIRTFVEIMKGFARAHRGCRGRPLYPQPPRPPINNGEDWMRYGEVGTSSETIWSVLSGHPIRDPGLPGDPDDFRRCHLLLEALPWWRGRLPEVAVVYPEWGPMVREWPRMTELFLEELPTGRAPRLYELMQKLREEGYALKKKEL